ncbi:AsmA family protein [Ottowia testudinis]|uniref:AsmA family protein n=1 Tax=Ottowia testudinis TaxID=2816950 RepID=A0A975CIT1_9BURK|nr:AsmA family protein [Ottowia testudinis]QTD47105.1 AsmA family protein [Ottowia testudinis]
MTDSDLKSSPHVSPLRWLLGLLAALLVAVAAMLAWLTWNDWNRSRAWVSTQVTQAIGRDFAIRGPLDLDWQWPQQMESGWRRWIPTPIVHAEDVLIGNPPGFAAKGPHFARIGRASADIALLPLLARRIDIRSVALTEPDVRLERLAEENNNWTFDMRRPSGSDARWSVSLGRLLLSKGQLGYEDALRQLSVSGTVDTLPPDQTEDGRYGIGFDFSGWQGKAQVRGSGKAGQLLSLREEQLNYPLKLDARAGRLGATAQGSIANPRALSGLDFQVALKGGSMADLYALTGIVLPDTPPFQTKGRLVGTLKPEGAVWDYQGFTGTVGKSDLAGDVTYTSGQPRPALKGKLRSKLLRLEDLGPLVGVQSNAPDKKPRPGKALPDDPFDTSRWDKMDLDLHYTGQRIERPRAVPLDSLRVHAFMDNAQLKLAPLDFGVAKGRFTTQVLLDSRVKPMQVSLRGDVKDLRLSALFPKIELMKKSLGDVDGGIALDARGQSVAQMLATANGEAKLYVRDGVMSEQLLDLAGLNLGSVVVSKLFGRDREVRLRCAIADVPVRGGVAYLQNVKINTEDALIEATGTADMRQELFDIDVNPKAYELKLFSLRTPLEVRGPFIKPHVGVKPGPLIVRAAAAVAALATAPGALVLLPVTVPGAEDNESCGPLLAKATGAPKAGPPVVSASRSAPAVAQPAPAALPAAGEFSGAHPQR